MLQYILPTLHIQSLATKQGSRELPFPFILVGVYLAGLVLFQKREKLGKVMFWWFRVHLFLTCFWLQKLFFVCGRLIRFLIKPMEKPQQKIMSKISVVMLYLLLWLMLAVVINSVVQIWMTVKQACFVINRQFLDLKTLSTNEWLPYLI